MADKQTIDRYRANLREEVDAVHLYTALAGVEAQPQLAGIYRRMAEMEMKHAAHWEAQLRAAGAPLPERRPSWRARTMAWLARKFGISVVLPTVAAAENANRDKYKDQPEAREVNMPAEERSHGKLLSLIAETSSRGMAGSSLVKLESHHRSIGGNALRAAVLGANDGLCSNLSLVMAVAGATHGAEAGHAVLIAGLAGLLAGACSMAMGEWLSVQSSRELYLHEMEKESEELAAAPEEEMEELSLIYQAKGIDPLDAKKMAEALVSDPRHALDTLAREELGIDPGELGGSAWEAAGASFLLFVAGAIFPVAPFLFLSSSAGLWVSLGVSTAALFGIGAGISLMTGTRLVFSGMRQILFGLGAAGITWLVGRLIGVAIS